MGPGSDDPHAGWVEGTQLKVPESQADLQPKSYPLKQLLSRSQTTQLRTPALLLSGHTARASLHGCERHSSVQWVTEPPMMRL